MENPRFTKVLELQYIIDDKRNQLKKVKGNSIWDSKKRVELKIQIQDLEEAISLYL